MDSKRKKRISNIEFITSLCVITMSYVFMKALENAPERYDRGIRWLAWGRLEKIRAAITHILGKPGLNVLEIGIGTGDQAIQLAQHQVKVTGIDISSGMLTICKQKIEKIDQSAENKNEGLPITLLQRAATDLDDFKDDSFDAILSCLCFSELDPLERRFILQKAHRILKPNGYLILADEIVPDSIVSRILHKIIDFPLRVITYLLTQISTHPISHLDSLVRKSGFIIEDIQNFQLGSFRIITARNKLPELMESEGIIQKNQQDELELSSYLEIAPPSLSVLQRFWQTTFRLLPHPTNLGIIRIGNPIPSDPVLCTCNFGLTVHRVVKTLEKKKMSVWLLVAPSKGINVWCGACGNHFTTDSILTILRLSGIEHCVNHRNLILPQLAAPAIDPIKILRKTGWNINWGPIRIDDLSESIQEAPTRKQRSVKFSFKERIDMANMLCWLILLLLTVPLAIWAIFSPHPEISLSLLIMIPIYFYGFFLLWPFIFGAKGYQKVVVWAIFLQLIILAMIWLIFGGFRVVSFWPLMAELWILTGILISDIDGMTTTVRSGYSARLWKRGKTSMFKVGNFSLDLSPYGIITAKIESCIGCGVCIEVCPANVVDFDESARKIILARPEKCVNCHACINRCPQHVFKLLPES